MHVAICVWIYFRRLSSVRAVVALRPCADLPPYFLTTGSTARPVSFQWKAHPVELRSTVVAADRPHSFAIVADARGLHAERKFTVRPAPDGVSTVVVSDETQVGLLPRLGRVFLAPGLRAANQAMMDDLARAASHGAAVRATAT